MPVPKYSGPSDPKTPYDFIVELEKFQSVIGYTDAEMLQLVTPMALRGEAYSWYRNERPPFSVFADFKVRLRREFQAIGYHEELRKELEKRTQGTSEPLTSYIRAINEYYERLGDHSVLE